MSQSHSTFRARFSNPTLPVFHKHKQAYGLQLIHESICVCALPAPKAKSTSSDWKPRDALFLYTPCQPCNVEHTLHPNSISMVTHILYIDQPLRCVSVCLFTSLPQRPLNHDNVWTTTSADKGFPSSRPPVARATFLSRQTLAQTWACIPEDLPGSLKRFPGVLLLLLLL